MPRSTTRLGGALALLISAAQMAAGQYVSSIHETIEADSASAITLDFVGDVEALNWPGNTVLVETDVRMYNTTEGAFEFFVEEDERYAVAAELVGGTLRIYNVKPERRPIKSRRGLAEEEVTIRIHVPDRFAIDTSSGSGVYTRIYARRASEGLRLGDLAQRRGGKAPPAELATALPVRNDITQASVALEDDPEIELLDASRLRDGVVISVDSSLIDFSTLDLDSVRIDSAALLTLPDRG